MQDVYQELPSGHPLCHEVLHVAVMAHGFSFVTTVIAIPEVQLELTTNTVRATVEAFDWSLPRHTPRVALGTAIHILHGLTFHPFSFGEGHKL